MSTYAVGDIQGCYDELQALLHKIKFDKHNDTLWLVGDLVNRGPKSLAVLRFIKELGDAAVTVLGNHDLHLLAVAYGFQTSGKHDTLTEILAAPDCGELLEWLWQQPLIYHDKALKCTLVHAGVLPRWSLPQALALAQEVEHLLQGTTRTHLLKNMYSNEPTCWSDTLTGIERQRFIINAFTRLRYIDRHGCLNLTAKMPPAEAPADLIPWYNVPERNMAQQKIIFGHWAALNGVTNNPHAINIDTGCAWGNQLTAINVSSNEIYRVPSLMPTP